MSRRRHGSRVIFLLLLTAGAALALRVAQERPRPYREVRYLMATFVALEACPERSAIPRIEGAFAAAWERLDEIAWRMNVYDERSDVAKVNQSFQSPVRVEADTMFVIRTALEMNARTQGAFDITVWPLITLWRSAQAEQAMPDAAVLAEVMESVGPDRLRLNADGTIETRTPETSIDLGGIAKGYAIDETARILREHGLRDFFVDAGGDVYAGGHNCSGEDWRIGIQDPRETEGVLRVVTVRDAAVATSGDYQQFLEINGEKFSHIIDPRTGYPQRHINSATAVAPTAITADALATALTVLTPEEGRRLLDGLGDGFAGLTISRRVEDDTWEEYPSRNFSALARPGPPP